MTIEKLTDEERERLATDPVPGAKKALRIIDAYAAERVALAAVIERVRAVRTRWCWETGEYLPVDKLYEALAGVPAVERMKCQECGNAEGVHDSGHFGILCNDVAACNQRCVDAWYAAEVERLKDRSPA
jgi:hypothetical protein